MENKNNNNNPFHEMMKDNPFFDYGAAVSATWQEYYKHLAINNATLMQRLTYLTMNCMNNNNKDSPKSSFSTSNSSASSL